MEETKESKTLSEREDMKQRQSKRLDHLNQDAPVKSVAANRQAKISELKSTLKLAREEFKLFLQIDPKEMTEEEKKDNSEISVQKQAIILALAEDLKQTKLNVNSSKYFVFIPSPANRRMRKSFKQMR